MIERFVGGGRDLIAGDLFHDELIVRLVGVEGADDVVAIAQGIGIGDILVHAVGVGIASEIEPVPRPALAIMGRGEQPIDDLRERLGRLISEEGVDLLGGRWQPGQVERGAAYQGPLIGRRGRRQPLFLELGQDETIDRRRWPAHRFHTGRNRVARRLKGPERFLFLGEERTAGGLRCGRRPGRAGAGPDGPRADPFGELGDLGVAELSFGRHLQLARVADRLDQPALARLARHERPAPSRRRRRSLRPYRAAAPPCVSPARDTASTAQPRAAGPSSRTGRRRPVPAPPRPAAGRLDHDSQYANDEAGPHAGPFPEGPRRLVR